MLLASASAAETTKGLFLGDADPDDVTFCAQCAVPLK